MENAVYGDGPGYGSWCTPLQWQRYQFMKSELTSDSLLALTNYPAPAVRCYAFYALYERQHPAVFSTLLQHLHDTDTIRVSYGGCFVWEENVASQLFNAHRFCKDKDHITLWQRLTDTQRDSVRHIFLRQLTQLDINPDLRTSILSELPLTEDNHRILVSILSIRKDLSLFLRLAAFQRQEDISLLMPYLEELDLPLATNRHDASIARHGEGYALKAIEAFPDSAFFKPLMRYIQRTDISEKDGYRLSALSALCKYKNDEAKSYLTKLVAQEQSRTLNWDSVPYIFFSTQEILWIALKKSTDSYYEDLLRSIENSAEYKKNHEYWQSDFQVLSNTREY